MGNFPAKDDFFAPAAGSVGPTRTAQREFYDAARQLAGARARTSLTLAADTATPTQGTHAIDTEAAAATDDLKWLQQTNLPDGWLLYIRSADNARDIVVKHAAGGAGQILLADGADFTLADTTMGLILQRSGTSWVEVDRSYGGNKVGAFDAIKQAATETATGVVELATQAEAEAGTDNTRVLTALRVAQAIAALGNSTALSTDVRMLSLLLAQTMNAVVYLYDGWADNFSDQTGVETGSNVNATYVSTGGGYYHNPAPAGTLDSYAEANQDSVIGLYAGSNTITGQAVSLATNAVITGAKFFLVKQGTPTGTVYVELYACSGAPGSTGVPTGAVLASASFDVTTLTTVLTLYTYTFSAAYAAAAGNYCVLVRFDGGSVGNSCNVGIDLSAPAHAGNCFINTLASPTAYPSYDTVFYLLGGSPPNMTVVSKAVVPAASAPTTGKLLIQIKDISGTAVVNTDFEGYVSRNNGTTWTKGTFVFIQTLADGTKEYEFTSLDISAQPSGTSVRGKFVTLNNKEIQLHGWVAGYK